MRTFNYIILILLLLSTSYGVDKPSQFVNFYIDAIAFKAKEGTNGRVDIFVVVPYQAITFLKNSEKYYGKYSLLIEMYDTNKVKVNEKRLDKIAISSNYFESQGGDAKFDVSSYSTTLSAGTYDIKVKFLDEQNSKSDERNRQVVILDYSKLKIAMSGIMLASSIEENNGKYKITPHANDNVANLNEGYFAFFELYNNTEAKGELQFYATVTNEKNELIYACDTITKSINKSKEQIFLNIPYKSELSGTYLLNVFTYNPESKTEIAGAQRTIKSQPTIYGYIRKDLDLAIKQLRYAATSKEIDEINSATTRDEKQRKFDEFWKKLDPTPQSDRNEAFDEFYTRINQANSSFKSYTDGWLTDKGMVYIIYGRPSNIDSYTSNVNNTRYERWIYSNNREFIFADNNGFGDFRLVRPMNIPDKFRYKQ